ncbi:3-phosphoshikimate 1-carboxyvinyltransferase [Striga asiatica]|uniref:3-phosphoshikimate 1-carboxyvinyltransferase n=1 Tax=Striga asiatica TaxID=4170 RepID=A0A5A7QHW0_STRAF|nr:3-phosphoshikimate 1-carboxyvinyltransferase [Striga asiatica]
MRVWSQRVVDLVRRFSNNAPPTKTNVFSTTPRAFVHPFEPVSESEPETESLHMLLPGSSTSLESYTGMLQHQHGFFVLARCQFKNRWICTLALEKTVGRGLPIGIFEHFSHLESHHMCRQT